MGVSDMGNNFGMWAMICGALAVVLAILNIPVSFIPLVGVCTCCTGPIAFFAAIAAIVLGIIGIVTKGGKGLAIGGILLAVLYFVIEVIWIVVSIIFSVGMALGNFA
jgi:hypothetical protein